MTLPVLPYGTALRGQDASDWAVAILEALGAPVTKANVYSLAGWFLREGGGGQNNPMNTTLGSQYPAINSDGVRNFPTPEIGVYETVATLKDGYSAVVADFVAGTGLSAPSPAARAELLKWSGGGYSSIVPAVVPMPSVPSPTPIPKEVVVAIAATTDSQGLVHFFQELSSGEVYATKQETVGGKWTKPYLLLDNGKMPASDTVVFDATASAVDVSEPAAGGVVDAPVDAGWEQPAPADVVEPTPVPVEEPLTPDAVVPAPDPAPAVAPDPTAGESLPTSSSVPPEAAPSSSASDTSAPEPDPTEPAAPSTHTVSITVPLDSLGNGSQVLQGSYDSIAELHSTSASPGNVTKETGPEAGTVTIRVSGGQPGGVETVILTQAV